MSKRRRTTSRKQQSTIGTLLALAIILLIFWLFPELQDGGQTNDPAQPPSASQQAEQPNDSFPPPGADQPNDTGLPPRSGQQANANLNLALGNPSNATDDTNDPDNYLISRDQYVLSYNRDGGIPNWVSWHLSTADMGSTDRSSFQPDPDLPQGWYRVRPSDYTNSGYDRGHMAPSADRTLSTEDNLPLFFMSNIVPQAPDNNQGPWVQLEEYCRDLARGGNELYIISGVRGSQGTLSQGRIRIPSQVWKVIVVLAEGDDDLVRINNRTKVIAVDMPNRQGIRADDWRSYLTSVDQIEERTGYDFLSNVNPIVQQAIEAVVAAP